MIGREGLRLPCRGSPRCTSLRRRCDAGRRLERVRREPSRAPAVLESAWRPGVTRAAAADVDSGGRADKV